MARISRQSKEDTSQDMCAQRASFSRQLPRLEPGVGPTGVQQ